MLTNVSCQGDHDPKYSRSHKAALSLAPLIGDPGVPPRILHFYMGVLSTIYVSAYWLVAHRILSALRAIRVRMLLYGCLLSLLYMCPHTATYPHTAILVGVLSTIYVSAYGHVRACILPY